MAGATFTQPLFEEWTMTAFHDQIVEAWDEWESTTGANANNPDDFIMWAVSNKKLFPRPQDLKRLFRKEVTAALRQVMKRDDRGFMYRAKQCVLIAEKGTQYRLWFDTDKGGTTSLRQKAIRQRRDAVANDVYRAICDVDHMKAAFPGEQLSFLPDFTDDCAERRAQELLEASGKKAA
jgi:hypothetical protein